jgi:hypothetical protein
MRHTRCTGVRIRSYAACDKTLAALALHWAFGCNVRLHRHSQTAELCERSYPRHFRSPSYAYYEMRVGRAIVGVGPGRGGRRGAA